MKILLLTDVPPGPNYPAALFLDTLCRMVPSGCLACFCVVNPVLGARVSPDLHGLPVRVVDKPNEIGRERGGRINSKVAALGNLFDESLIAWRDIRRIAEQAVHFGREQGCDAVWCTLEGQTMIRLARRVALDLGVPLRTQVFDPPHWWLRAHRVNAVTTRAILAEFDAAIRDSAACATASWAMEERYRLDHGTECVAVVPCLDARLARQPRGELNDGEPFIIGMAGQFYAMKEWRALIRALDLAHWRIGDRDVVLRVLGRNMSASVENAVHIEYFGWRSQAETIDHLSGASVLYCPYWFDRAFRREAKLSFPSKLVTYLAAGRPVFFHGPAYASPHRFLHAHGAAMSCHSLKPQVILDGLENLASDNELRSRLAEAGSLAFSRYFSTDAVRPNFRRFLGID